MLGKKFKNNTHTNIYIYVCICMCMGLTRYEKSLRVLEGYVKENGDYIETQPLKELFARHLGGDENRVIMPALKMLREFGIITEVKLNRWKIKLPTTY